ELSWRPSGRSRTISVERLWRSGTVVSLKERMVPTSSPTFNSSGSAPRATLVAKTLQTGQPGKSSPAPLPASLTSKPLLIRSAGPWRIGGFPRPAPPRADGLPGRALPMAFDVEVTFSGLCGFVRNADPDARDKVAVLLVDALPR